MAIASDLGCAVHSATYIRCQTQNVMGSFCEILLSDSMLGRPFDLYGCEIKNIRAAIPTYCVAGRVPMIDCDVRYWHLTDIPGDLIDDGGIR
jgi:hypothetical protein